MSPARKKARKPVKVTDEASVIRCVAGDGLIREEVWKDAKGIVVRYNLAFINFHLFSQDNGPVLGYDTAHGHPHRHFAGRIETVAPVPYYKVLERLMKEVAELRKRERL